MKCPKCGKLIEDDSLYCTYCGANLKNTEATGKQVLESFLHEDNKTKYWEYSAPNIKKESHSTESKSWTEIVGIICIVLGLIRALFGNFVIIGNDPYSDPGFLDIVSSWLGDSGTGIGLVLATLGVIIIMLGKGKNE